MARTTITPTNAPGNYAAAGTALALAAADVPNGNQFKSTGKEVLVAQNTGAGAHAVTVTSVNDPYGRAGSITAESIAAGAVRVYGPFPTLGWQQSDGNIYCSADHAEVKFGVIVLP